MTDEIIAQKALIFGKYDTSEVIVSDGGLAKYIDLTPTNVPHSGGKHANRWFGKSKLSIVERLINNIMRTEKYTGKNPVRLHKNKPLKPQNSEMEKITVYQTEQYFKKRFPATAIKTVTRNYGRGDFSVHVFRCVYRSTIH